MLTFITDIKSDSEPDLLHSHRFFPLMVTTLDGAAIASYAPPRVGWQQPQLEQISRELSGTLEMGANAYLGKTWIGSTEV